MKQILKHDFFAATALYEIDGKKHQGSKPAKIILKLGRQQYFFGLPLLWLGKLLCEHEVAVLGRLSDVQALPKVLSRYSGTGFIYEYIEGQSLDEVAELSDDFFDRLEYLINQIHKCNVVYIDMNKRGNIIVGADGQPYIIDFQISMWIDDYSFVFKQLSKLVRDALQQADIYHLLKHKRKLRPELLKPEELDNARSRSWLIELHRTAATPLRKLRRNFLRYLYSKGLITAEQDGNYSKENDPARFVK